MFCCDISKNSFVDPDGNGVTVSNSRVSYFQNGDFIHFDAGMVNSEMFILVPLTSEISWQPSKKAVSPADLRTALCTIENCLDLLKIDVEYRRKYPTTH